MIDPTDILKTMIAEKAESDRSGNVWTSGRFMPIKTLSLDTRGELGELFIERLLTCLGHSVIRNSATDRTNKHWDLLVNDSVSLEVKTATVGKDGRSFQHENIEKDRNYDGLVLLDIAPDAIYLTAAPKKHLPFSTPNDKWTRSPRRMHRRAQGIQYKWDLSILDVKEREVRSIADVRRLMAELIPPKP